MKALFFCFLLILSTVSFSQKKDIQGTWCGQFAMPSPFKGLRFLKLPTEDVLFPLIFNIENTNGEYKVMMHDPDNRSLHNNVIFFMADSTPGISIDGQKLKFRGKLINDTLMEGKCTYFSSYWQPFKLIKQKESISFERPQESLPPFPYTEEEVNIKNINEPDISIACTFSFPDQTNPLPAVILIPGTGAIDRDGNIAYHKMFHVIADYLNRQGIAVIRYDKRGVGKSSGKYDGATIEELTTDVKSIFEFLKNRREIDAKKIGFLGHSMGGGIAYSTTAARNDVAFVISLGTHGVSGEEIGYQQKRVLLRNGGLSEEFIHANEKLIRELLAISKKYPEDFVLQNIDSISKTLLPDSLKNSINDIKFVSNNLMLLYNPFHKSFLEYNPTESLKNVKCPVLILNGDKDYLVDKTNAEKIKKTLNKYKNNNATVKIYPDLNHLFQTCKTGSLQEYIWLKETISPKVLNDISDWIIKVVD